jgi:hypothetical protein
MTRQDSGANPVTEAGQSLAHAMALPCAHKCVLAAQKVIDIISHHQTSDDSVEPLPAWWYKIFCKLPYDLFPSGTVAKTLTGTDIYTAATVLIAARIYRPLHGEISDDCLKCSWH